MAFKITPGSGGAGFGIIGTGLALALPDQRWIGYFVIFVGVLVLLWDVRFESGHIRADNNRIERISLWYKQLPPRRFAGIIGLFIAVLLGLGIIAKSWIEEPIARQNGPSLGPKAYFRLTGLKRPKNGDDNKRNAEFVGSGDMPAIGVAFSGDLKIVNGALIDGEIDRQFNALYAAARELKPDGDDEVQKGEVIYQTFSFNRLTSEDWEGLQKGYKTMYAFLVLRYKDRKLPPGEWWRQEICLMPAANGSFGVCAHHNRQIKDR